MDTERLLGPNELPRHIIVGDSFKSLCKTSTELIVYSYVASAYMQSGSQPVILPTKVLATMTGNDTPAIRKAMRALVDRGAIARHGDTGPGKLSVCSPVNIPEYKLFLYVPLRYDEDSLSWVTGLDLLILRVLLFYSMRRTQPVFDVHAKIKEFVPVQDGRITKSLKILEAIGAISAIRKLVASGHARKGYKVVAVSRKEITKKKHTTKPKSETPTSDPGPTLLSEQEAEERLADVLDRREWPEYCSQLGLTLPQLVQKLRDPEWEPPEFDPSYGTWVAHVQPQERREDDTVVTDVMIEEAVKHRAATGNIPGWLRDINRARVASGKPPILLPGDY